jgi:predicted RNase H-like HicB family nuclease
MKTYYTAGFVPESETGWSVYFPDFPEIHTDGDSLEEATENAADALKTMLEAMVRDNDAIPSPSNLTVVKKQVKAIRELDELPYPKDTVYQLVAAPSLDLTPVRVNVSIPKAALAEIDEKARSYGFTRSGFLAHAALLYQPEG